MDPSETLKRLLQFGGFPEPFLANSIVEAKRFRISHLDKILRGDLLDLAQVRDLRKIELLVDILAERVGSSISYSNLAQDLEVSPHTVKSWISILESLYIVFVVTPYSQKISRAISKEPKVYFFDTGRIHDSPGARLENVVACALLKDIHFHEDVLGDTGSLHYLRTRTGQEVDFLVLRNKKPYALIEVKVSDSAVSPNLFYFNQFLKPERVIQVVQNLGRGYLGKDHELIKVVDFLSSLEQF
jgi:predicted AAA+ superfamily ATPase